MTPLPCLNLAIARLTNTGTDNFAIWVVKAPYPSGYVLHDCIWPVELSQVWQEWQEMFGGDSPLGISSQSTLPQRTPLPINLVSSPSGQTAGYSSRLMQYLGISLWRWLFDGSILGSLERSRGIAMGQHTRLRFRLEVRDPDLIALPWEIMQREAGQSVMSLSQDLLFSRTTSEVESLPYLRTEQALNILLVLGENENKNLQLEKEAEILKQTLTKAGPLGSNSQGYAPCMVHTLLQPQPQELIQELETKAYNVFFYAGHGLPDPDGGLLFLRPGMTLNGIELAQVLTRNAVKLAVFNACWLAQPAAANGQAIPSSSLAEVLIRHGVPGVLGMRDEIADAESHSFIQAFTEALRSRKPIDEAVAEARQQLLTTYRFNQPAWTLPVLYLHPDFDGELIKSFDEGITELPDTTIPSIIASVPSAFLRSLAPGGKTWLLRAGVTRIGRTKDNDIVIPEPSVSKRHAEILCRNTFSGTTPVRTYYLEDKSTYGTTWVSSSNGWQQILREEVPLTSGMQLKFGSSRGETWEFIIEDS
ncbi:FHA domain containing protein [Calothrix sp. NIES-2100]|nr:FHA domain containing protein [Calothrix sp. NIES-2100]